jgi:bifunctional non-homologous end joining protein LigD
VFEHACKMGLEGIVSKRLGSRYRSGRTSDWLKFKNPAAPAVG